MMEMMDRYYLAMRAAEMKARIYLLVVLAAMVLAGMLVLGTWLGGRDGEWVREEMEGELAKVTAQLVEARSREGNLLQDLEGMEGKYLSVLTAEARLREELEEKEGDVCLFAAILPGFGTIIPLPALAQEEMPPDMTPMFVCGKGIEYRWPALEGAKIPNRPDLEGRGY